MNVGVMQKRPKLKEQGVPTNLSLVQKSLGISVLGTTAPEATTCSCYLLWTKLCFSLPKTAWIQLLIVLPSKSQSSGQVQKMLLETLLYNIKQHCCIIKSPSLAWASHLSDVSSFHVHTRLF